MGAADFLEQQLKVLAGAAGDPALLALATVDLAHSSLDESQRHQLKATLEAAAVPHWIDEPVLAALIGALPEESARQLAALRTLRVVEPFPARGFGAVNVHNASRKALRARLRKEQPQRFSLLSARARETLLQRRESICRIDALYHYFAIDQEAAATEWERLQREIVHPVEQETMATELEELLAEGWLNPTAKVVVRLMRAFIRVGRNEYKGIDAIAREAIPVAEHADRQALLGFAHYLSGEAHAFKGETDEAAKGFGTYLDIFTRLHQREPRTTWITREVAVAHTMIAGVHETNERWDDAERAMEEAASILSALVGENAEDADILRQLATCQIRIANILVSQSNRARALEKHRMALDTYLALTRRDPTNSGWLRDVAMAHTNIGRVLSEEGDPDGALTAFQNALEINRRVVELDPDNASVQGDLASAYSWVGSILSDKGNLDDSLSHHAECIAIRSRLVDRYPDNAEMLRDLAIARWSLALSTAKLGREKEAATILRESEQELLRVIKLAPKVAVWQRDLENVRSWIEKYS